MAAVYVLGAWDDATPRGRLSHWHSRGRGRAARTPWAAFSRASTSRQRSSPSCSSSWRPTCTSSATRLHRLLLFFLPALAQRCDASTARPTGRLAVAVRWLRSVYSAGVVWPATSPPTSGHRPRTSPQGRRMSDRYTRLYSLRVAANRLAMRAQTASQNLQARSQGASCTQWRSSL
jgi:hypothetical protein